MVERGGVYYEVLKRENEADEDTYIVVLFFEDSILDTVAEIIKLKVELK